MIQTFMRNARVRTLMILAALGILLLVAAGGTYLHAHADTQPSATDVVAPIGGLHSPVSITIDQSGIPHIAAASESDMVAGLCYAEARDRLFQMEFDRLAADGRLASVFGAGPDNLLLSQDLLFRTLDLPALAAQQWPLAAPRVRADLTACAAGINAYRSRAIATHTLPPEFALLGYTPAPWAPQDSLTLSDWLDANLEITTWSTKLVRGAIASGSSPALANALTPESPGPTMFDASGHLTPISAFLQAPTPFTPTSMQPGTLRQQSSTSAPTSALARLQLGTMLAGMNLGNRASNNWAVDGTLTASGKPLLANDPHVALTMPSQAYLAAFSIRGGPSFEGVTFPAMPFFISGHNGDIAYAVTLAIVDDADLYEERMRATTNGKEQVYYRGHWVEASTHVETITIAPEDPTGKPTTEQLPVTVTPHGPLLNAALGLDPSTPIALREALADPSWRWDNLYALPFATDWTSFRAAATSTLGTGLNFLFGDNASAHGHIGYQMTALVPVRDAENALYPVPGWDGQHEWGGFLSATALPQIYNPPTHMLATGNDPIVPDNWTRGYISNAWDLPWRVQAIYRDLTARSDTHKLTAADMIAIQSDTQTVAGQPIAADLISAAWRAGGGTDATSRAALATVANWDGNASTSSAGAAIYEAWLALFTRDLIAPALGNEYSGYTTFVFSGAEDLAAWQQLEQPTPALFGTQTRAQANTARDALAAHALAEAVQLLQGALGPNPSAWSWGALHTLTYDHPLASVDPRFALGTFPSGGDVATIDVGGWFTGIGALALSPDQLQAAGGAPAAFAQDALAVARVVWDLADANGSYGITSTGQSGDPASVHWADDASLWRAGKNRRLAFTASALNSTSDAQTDHLVPA